MGNSMGHWKNKWGVNWESKRGVNWKSKRGVNWRGKRSSNRGYEGSSWEMKTSIEKELRIGISVTLVKTVDRLVAVARKRASIARCKVWSVCIGVCVWGIVVQRIGFRLSQAERGYGENYDLKKKSIDQDLQASQLGMLTMHFMMCTGLLS